MEPQTITPERPEVPPPPRRGWIVGVVAGAVALAAVIVSLGGAGVERSADRTGTTLVWEPPPPTSSTTLPPETTAVSVPSHQTSVISYEEGLAGPQFNVRQIAPPTGLTQVHWIGAVGNRMAVVGSGHDESGGALVAWSDGSQWTEVHTLEQAGDLGAIVASEAGLLVTVSLRESGQAGAGVAIHTWDGSAWTRTHLTELSWVSSAAIGDAGATVFGERHVPAHREELLAAVPEEVRRVEESGAGWLTIEAGQVRLYWNHGVTLWQQAAADLGLEHLSQDMLHGPPESVMFVSEWQGEWREVEAPFASDGRWSVFGHIRHGDRIGVVPHEFADRLSRHWWTDDGVRWEEGEVALGFDWEPIAYHGETQHRIDRSTSSPAILTVDPEGRTHRRRFQLPGAEHAWIMDAAVSSRGVVWAMNIGPDDPGGGQTPAPVVVETLSGTVYLDVWEGALLVGEGDEQERWSLWEREGFEPDLEQGTMRLVGVDGSVAAEFALEAVDVAFESVWNSYEPDNDRTALLVATESGEWGLQELADGPPQALGTYGADWYVAVGRGGSAAALRLFRASLEG